MLQGIEIVTAAEGVQIVLYPPPDGLRTPVQLLLRGRGLLAALEIGVDPRILQIHAEHGHLGVDGIQKGQRIPVVLDVGQSSLFQFDAGKDPAGKPPGLPAPPDVTGDIPHRPEHLRVRGSVHLADLRAVVGHRALQPLPILSGVKGVHMLGHPGAGRGQIQHKILCKQIPVLRPPVLLGQIAVDNGAVCLFVIHHKRRRSFHLA